MDQVAGEQQQESSILEEYHEKSLVVRPSQVRSQQQEIDPIDVHQGNFNRLYWYILENGDPDGTLTAKMMEEKRKYQELFQNKLNTYTGDIRTMNQTIGGSQIKGGN